ncbi:MAG: hypothetical protein OEY51_07230 [Cyclobacteriaceae bacterium]|nr:hypothetical protein [Cyclobacteriaceae bacterium]
MNDILEKYNSLSPEVQKEVEDFLDFMINRAKGNKPFDMKSWKKRITQIPVWSRDDIKVFEEGRKHINDWKGSEW